MTDETTAPPFLDDPDDPDALEEWLDEVMNTESIAAMPPDLPRRLIERTLADLARARRPYATVVRAVPAVMLHARAARQRSELAIDPGRPWRLELELSEEAAQRLSSGARLRLAGRIGSGDRFWIADIPVEDPGSRRLQVAADVLRPIDASGTLELFLLVVSPETDQAALTPEAAEPIGSIAVRG